MVGSGFIDTVQTGVTSREKAGWTNVQVMFIGYAGEDAQ